MKVVLDTNVWLSALFWEGEAYKLISQIQNKLEIIISKEIISEIVEVLNKEAKFQKFLENKEKNIEDLIRTILSISTLVEAKSKITLIKSHPKDNDIISAAIDGKAEYIVSYNKHVLDIIEYNKIRILTPEDFLKLINRNF